MPVSGDRPAALDDRDARGALPGSRVPGRVRRRRAAGRPRRTGGVAGSASLPSKISGGALAAVVGTAGGVVAQLDDPGDVEHVVEAAVAGAREPMAQMLAAGGIDRGSASPGREVVAVGKPGDVAHVGENAGGAAGPMPWMSIRCEPVAWTAALSSAFIALSLASSRVRSCSSSAAIRRQVLPARSRGRTLASRSWYWLTDFFTGASARDQIQEQPVQPVEGLGPGAGQFITAAAASAARLGPDRR